MGNRYLRYAGPTARVLEGLGLFPLRPRTKPSCPHGVDTPGSGDVLRSSGEEDPLRSVAEQLLNLERDWPRDGLVTTLHEAEVLSADAKLCRHRLLCYADLVSHGPYGRLRLARLAPDAIEQPPGTDSVPTLHLHGYGLRDGLTLGLDERDVGGTEVELGRKGLLRESDLGPCLLQPAPTTVLRDHGSPSFYGRPSDGISVPPYAHDISTCYLMSHA